jgi:hypothetical protein
MPKTLATKDSGRKITVMMVKTTAALSRQSWTPRICARACLLVSFGDDEWSLRWHAHLALQIVQHVAEALYDIFLDLDAFRQRSEDDSSWMRIVVCVDLRVVRREQSRGDLPQNIDLLLLQLRESVQLMAEIAYPVEWFATWFACEDVRFLSGGQRVFLSGTIDGSLTKSVTYRMYMFKAS